MWQLHNTNRDRPRYVTKRRDEILAHSTPDLWHYVRSEDNPADDCTRGIAPKDFGPGCRWINGPKFLTDPEYIAPPFVRSSVTVEEEEATAVNVNSLAAEPSYCHPSAAAKMICRLTDLITLKRQVAQLLRTDQTSTVELSAAELAEAFRVCLAVLQGEAFVPERKALLKKTLIPQNSVLRRVGPYLNKDDGLLKVDGRLEHAELPARTRHPVIIAPDHPLTKLIIEDCHRQVHNSGVEHTLSIVREQFFLPQGRRAIRRTLANCVECKILHSLPKAQRMANLHKERLQGFLRVFTNVGLDCFGPFNVVMSSSAAPSRGMAFSSRVCPHAQSI